MLYLFINILKKSNFLPMIGIEPILEVNEVLSHTRLPIPPHGFLT